MAEIITLAGRKFIPVRAGQSTLLFNYWAMNLVQRIGLDQITQAEHETPEDYMVRLHRQGIQFYPQMMELIAGMLVPEGIDSTAWTPKIASENLDLIASLTDPKDQEVVNQQFMALLLGFFQKGLSYSKISQKSLKESPKAGQSAIVVQ